MSSDFQLPWPKANAHKYSRGKLTIIAGSARYPGAAVLAARAAQRMGAGYVEVITAKRAVDVVRVSAPSLVVRAFAQWDVNELVSTFEESAESDAACARPRAVVIGPGFVPGKRDGLLRAVLACAPCPVLVDGGALHHLASNEMVATLTAREFPTVVTPHAGEAARLAHPLRLGGASPDKQAAALALALNAVVVLKGPTTYVSDGRRVEVMDEGTPALAKAGTGDVLAGMIGALLAQGSDAFSAALTGVVVHALAGVAAAEQLSEIAVCPEDVVEAIPSAIKAL